MEAEDRAAADSLIRRLAERPYSFDFFQAVRRLECARKPLPPVGHSRTPAEDPVRLCQNPSLAFAPSTIEKVEPGKGGRPPRLFVRFAGLLGPNGPMPIEFTAYARERMLRGDQTIARFLDVFHHRMLSFFYRAWASCQQAVNYERGEGDRYAVYIGSTFGLGMPSLRGRDRVPDTAKLHYSGHLACQTRHADGLRSILEDYFGVEVQVEEFVGQWLELPPDCLCRLGESPATGSLGRTAICGRRIWDCQQKFRLRFGPMGLADYERMLPDGTSFARLRDWLRLYLCDELTWELQLVLKKEEVPKARLGHYGRLGWTTWLQSRPPERDADNLVLRPPAA